MIDAKRIGELKSWLTFAKARIYLPDEDDRNARAELLAILSDYQAALPLLEAVERADMISNTKKHPGNYLHFIETDAEKILDVAMTWKNRPGAYNKRSQPNE